MSSAPGRSWRSPSRVPRTAGPRGGEAGPSRGKTPFPPRWRRAAREEASGGRGPSPSCRTPIPPPGPASPPGAGGRGLPIGRGPAPPPAPGEEAVQEPEAQRSCARRRVPDPGAPRRCGGGDEAACGARKKSRRAEPAASGRKVASVAEGTPPRARGPGTGRTMTGAPCAEYARTCGNPSPPLEPRVGGVLDPLAQEVVPEDGDQDGQTGIDGEPPRELDVVLPRREDVPPGRGGRLHADSKEREA